MVLGSSPGIWIWTTVLSMRIANIFSLELPRWHLMFLALVKFYCCPFTPVDPFIIWNITKSTWESKYVSIVIFSDFFYLLVIRRILVSVK